MKTALWKSVIISSLLVLGWPALVDTLPTSAARHAVSASAAVPMVSLAFAVIQAAGTTGGAMAGAANEPESADRLTPNGAAVRVLVIDYTGADAETVSQAMHVAERIFANCGVELKWSFARTGQGEAADLAGATYFVRLLPNRLARITGSTPDALGSAAGRLANAYYESIWQTSEGQRFGPSAATRVPVSVLLGHVIAHELGHLLLGPHNHSAAGIMRADWNRNDALPEMRAGRLGFTEDQARRIRERAAGNRTEFAAAAQVEK